MKRFLTLCLATTFGAMLALCANALGQEKLVFDFESGRLDDWTIVEGANTKPIGSRDVEFHNNSVPYDKSGKYYLTTLESTANESPTDDTICVIESPVFVIDGDVVEFLVGGAGNRDAERVELALLKEDGDVEPVMNAKGKDSQKLDPVKWDVSQYRGRRAVIRVVDLTTGPWAHMRCDAFQIAGRLDPDGAALRKAFCERVAREKAEREAEARKMVADLLPDAVLYVRRTQYRPDHHNTATIFQPGEINENSFVGGSALALWYPKENRSKDLLQLEQGVVRDPTLSFDAKKVLFSFRLSKDDFYHIGEMTLEPERETIVLKGNETREEIAALPGFKQLTFVQGASDIDPIYLPTGEIVFSSTREPKYCMCNRHIMCNLHKMNGDGTNIEQIGKSTLFEGHSALLSDGRIIYDRWEYVDRNFGDAQGVWVTNPDGSKHEIFWGNNTASPGGVIDAKPTPEDDSLFVCVLGSCHDRPWGAVALIDRRLGADGRKPVVQTWPPEVIDWVSDAPANDPFLEAVKYDTFRNSPRKYEDPFPLEDGYVLASGQTGVGEEMGIYLLTPEGDSILAFTDAPGCYDPIPVAPTTPPPTIADRVRYDDPNGYFHVSNVYEGFGMDKVEKGAVKYLRVVESPEKRFWTNPLWDGSGTQAPGMAWDDFNNKRILGIVDVKEDGSASFAVPAEKFVYFQLLDENYRLIQSMRSGIMVRPGETNACVGCHESRLDAPSSGAFAGAQESGEPQKLVSQFGEPKLYSYMEEVQPVFDKYCVTCHDFGKPAGEKLVLAGDRNLAFNASYWQIRAKNLVRVPGAGPHNVLPPYEWGSTKSKLAQIFVSGHDNAEIDQKRKEMGVYVDQKTDPDAALRVFTWIDINAPYYPTYGSAYRNNSYGRSPLTPEETRRLEELTTLKGLALAQAVSLDRPERSPCLNHWGAANALVDPGYREALEIITRGKDRLAKQGRGEESDFQPVADIEVDQERRYEYFQERAKVTRDAKRSGKRLNDLQLDAALGATWRAVDAN